ncbi:hypothetical protein ACP4OV_029319 [Aristida adscensionis]
MGEITKDTLEWAIGYPHLLRSFDTFVHLSDDIVSTERERSGNNCASTVQCYMNLHGTTMHEAVQKIKELTEDLWKDMLQDHLTMTEQRLIVSKIVLNFSRTGNYMYHNIDKFTSSCAIKETITQIFVEKIPI